MIDILQAGKCLLTYCMLQLTHMLGAPHTMYAQYATLANDLCQAAYHTTL